MACPVTAGAIAEAIVFLAMERCSLIGGGKPRGVEREINFRWIPREQNRECDR